MPDYEVTVEVTCKVVLAMYDLEDEAEAESEAEIWVISASDISEVGDDIVVLEVKEVA